MAVDMVVERAVEARVAEEEAMEAAEAMERTAVSSLERTRLFGGPSTRKDRSSWRSLQ